MRMHVSHAAVRIIAISCLLNLGLRTYVALRPLDVIDGMTVPDDAYLSLDIARNIAHGHGPLYAGEYTNGFQPLYVLLMVPVYMVLTEDRVAPVHVGLVMLSVADTLALWLLLRWISGWNASTVTLSLVALGWICNPAFIATAANGLETALASFFLVAALRSLDTDVLSGTGRTSAGRNVILGCTLGLAMLARIDNGFLVPVVAGSVLAVHRHVLREALRSLAQIAAGWSVVYLPWLVYSYVYTGDLYPVSGKAVRHLSLSIAARYPTMGDWYTSMVRIGLLTGVKHNLAVLLLIAAGAFMLVVRRHHVAVRGWTLVRSTLPAWSFGAMLFAAYTLYVFTPWFFDRYLHPLGIVLLLTLALVCELIFPAFRPRSTMLTAAGLSAALLILVNVSSGRFAEILWGEQPGSGYMQVGLWAERTFPKGTVTGSAQSGALGGSGGTATTTS